MCLVTLLYMCEHNQRPLTLLHVPCKATVSVCRCSHHAGKTTWCYRKVKPFPPLPGYTMLHHHDGICCKVHYSLQALVILSSRAAPQFNKVISNVSAEKMTEGRPKNQRLLRVHLWSCSLKIRHATSQVFTIPLKSHCFYSTVVSASYLLLLRSIVNQSAV